jgi:lipid-A-disaccharide synthase
MRIAIVAGEASGDALGAGLIEAVRAERPDAEFFGVAGPRMRNAGCLAWHETEELSVMGLAEVLRHLPRLLPLRRRLIERIRADAPDLFVGIDSPAFNLPVARALKRAGVPSVQYVSPQYWAWWQSRVRSLRESVDLVLCLLPFETEFYAEHGVRAVFVGHPLAEEIPLESDSTAARRALGLAPERPVVALLPGSRRSEVGRLAQPFIETAGWLQARSGDRQIVVALAHDRLRDELEQALSRVRLEAPPLIVTERAREVMTAADAVLTASGTAALETMLVKRPMVIAYKMSPVSYWLYRKLGIARLPHYTLPNLLAGRRLVAEFVQRDVRAEVLGPAIERCLSGEGLDPDWRAAFAAVHQSLRGGGSRAAAEAILALAASGSRRR